MPDQITETEPDLASDTKEAAFNTINSANADSEESAPSVETEEVSEIPVPVVHPVYQDLLNKIPESFRGQVAPHLQEWQRGSDERIRQVHSEYEPYKSLIESKADPKLLENGYALAQALQNNPRAVFDQIQTMYQFAVEQGQDDSEETEESTDVDPRFAQLEAQQTQITEMLQRQAYDQELAQANADIDRVFATIEDQLPDDKAKRFVTQQAMMLVEQHPEAPIDKVFEAALQEYKDLVPQVRPVAPNVPRGNASIPTQVKEPADMTATERKAYGLEYIRQMEQRS